MLKFLRHLPILLLALPLGARAQTDLFVPEAEETEITTPETTVSADAQPYVTRLARLPNVIDMPYNNVVRQYIDKYTGRLAPSVAQMLGQSNFYTPIFEDALEAYQVPLELKHLPVIESALNPLATSKAGAVGLWQFIITTGKQYGLEVTSLVDERRDPIKASHAAARYLRDLYTQLGDWTLVIAAYNCGPANVQKAIKRAGGANDFWQIYPYLPKETRGYVPAFIAANYVMTYYCHHDIKPTEIELPNETDTIIVARNVRMEQISELCGVSIEEIKSLNPQYRTTLIPGLSRPSTIKLRPEHIEAFIEAGDSIYDTSSTVIADVPVNVTPAKSQTNASRASYVRVRSGDTLGAIASRNGTTVAKIRRLNGLRGNTIRVGQRLQVR